jgi:hypothetical protein
MKGDYGKSALPTPSISRLLLKTYRVSMGGAREKNPLYYRYAEKGHDFDMNILLGSELTEHKYNSPS